jgi:hypothetical protein
MMGEEIGRRFTSISNLHFEKVANLTLEETNEGPHFKDDATFALLTTISLHMVAMLNEINNLLGLDAILNREPNGLRNCAS